MNVQEDTISVVELVTAFRTGRLDLPALLAALSQRGTLAEDDYRSGVDTLWKLREEQALDDATVGTLLQRLDALRAPAAAGDDVTVVKPARAAPPDDELTRVQPASSTGAPSPDGSTGTGTGTASLSSSLAAWERVAAASGQYVTVGSVLKGRFQLERELGRGGMGVVYLARDARKVEARDRDPWLAVKVLSDEFRRHPDSLVALQREARRSQQLAHDNIVRVYDFDKDDGIVFMTMEFVDGCDLRTLIREQAYSGMPLARARPLIEGMARALGRAHAAGIVHSDFKPGNVMVTPDGVPKVFDFGIARAGQHKADVAGEQTVFDAATLGALTPAYASLAMLRGQAPTPADDIYALGCVCFELLTGKHPFEKLSAEVAQREGRRPPPLAGLSKRQYRTLCAAVAFDAGARLPDVDELLDGLREIGWRERNLPALGYGTAAVVVLALAGVGVSRHLDASRLAQVTARLGADDPAEYRDEQQAWAGLATLDEAERARFMVEHADLVEGFLLRRLEALWAPAAGRYAYPATVGVFALRDRLRLYSPALDRRRAQIERERDVQLNALDSRLAALLQRGALFGRSADGLPATLAAIAAIDPSSALLRDPALELAYATAIERALDAQDAAAARGALTQAQASFPQSLRLKLLATRLQPASATVAAAAPADAAAAVKALDALLQRPQADAGWQAKVGAALQTLRAQAPVQLAAAQARLADAVATTLAGRTRPEQLPDDLLMLQFALQQVPESALLQQQRATLQQRQQAVLAGLEVERSQAEVAARSESLRRAVAAGDLDKAARMLERLRTLRPDDTFVREGAPALLEQGYRQQAEQQATAGDFAAASARADAGLRVLGARSGLQAARDRYAVVAAVISLSPSTPAPERLRVSQQLDALYRSDARGIEQLERDMHARGQLEEESLRLHLQRGSPAQAVAATPATAKAAVAARPAAAASAMLAPSGATAAGEDEPLPPIPDGPDPCAGSAGRGRTCYDAVGDARGPMLVVVPGVDGGTAYALSRGEIAVDDFNRYCAASGHCTPRPPASAELGRLPAQNVTFAQAKAYARWLTRASGGWRYRLPSDAEWLHAAQAQQQWKQAPDSNCIPPTSSAGGGAPVGVRGREPNPWGLVNLSGNVWEWVVNGAGAALRGGSYASYWSDCSVLARRDAPGGAQPDVGFRVLRELK
jgi:non-specific serine/threonine protein kinase